MRGGALIRSSPVLQRTLIVCLAILLALLASETLARHVDLGPMFGQQLVIREVPTRFVDGVPLWRDANSRYGEEDLRRASENPDAFTIVGLGDSIMFGVWQAQQDTYLEHVRRALATRAHRPVEILNLAVPGFNTLQEGAVFKEIEPQIRPDLVIVHYWGDDAHQYRVVGGYVVDLGEVPDDGQRLVSALPVPEPIGDFLLLHSRLYALLAHVVVAFSRDARAPDFTRVTAPLSDIHERAERAGARLLVLASADLSAETPQPVGDLARLQAFARPRGIEVQDLSEWLQGLPSQAISIDACHFNAEGHRLIGERLAEYLLAHDLKD